MPDVLGLLNTSIPLAKRYDTFLVWVNGKNHSIPELLAHEIEVNPSIIDVFFMLGDIDDYEFKLIDEKKFDIGALFIFIRFPKDVRYKVYSNAETLLASSQPLSSIKSFIDENNSFNAEAFIQQISPGCWSSIAKYLKMRSIVNGTITAKFRAFLVTCSTYKIKKQPLTVSQVQWIERAILHDKIKELGIFTNDTIVTDFNDDYLIFREIRNNIS